jgi:glutamate carboxypeptidase
MAIDTWVQAAGAEIGRRAVRELEALVGVSSPSGDVEGASECAAICAALLPDTAAVERIPCSSPGHAADLLATLRGSGRRRVLLLGHLDTVVTHAEHRPLTRADGRLVGSGAVDMKGGVVLSLGAMRAFAARREDYAELALLLVCDEEWRTTDLAHAPRFAGWDACLCFEAGELAGEAEGVVVRRKAAATVRVTARGRAAHSGSAPDRGRNALLALAAAAQAVAACHDPDGPQRLTAVPTILRSGEAFNVVPGDGELFADCRADDLAAVEGVCAAIPRDVGGVVVQPELVRRWPGMDARAHVGPVLERASAALGRPIAGVPRGGASDASHLAAGIPVTIDGLGPRGGKAHNPEEFVLAESLQPRAEVALAVLRAVLAE